MAKVVKRKDEDIESLLKRFKRQVNDEGIMEQLREREYYTAPALKRRLKSIKAQKRDRKLKKTTKYIDSRYDY